MNAEKLAHMANQIGQFFESWPDRQLACEEIASHLRRFWEPRMRESLITAIENGEELELRPIVKQAIDEYKAKL